MRTAIARHTIVASRSRVFGLAPTKKLRADPGRRSELEGRDAHDEVEETQQRTRANERQHQEGRREGRIRSRIWAKDAQTSVITREDERPPQPPPPQAGSAGQAEEVENVPRAPVESGAQRGSGKRQVWRLRPAG